MLTNLERRLDKSWLRLVTTRIGSRQRSPVAFYGVEEDAGRGVLLGFAVAVEVG